MSRVVLKFIIAYGASFAQLLVNKFDRVMSGHGAMTLQVVQSQAIFARNGAIECDIDHDKASFDYFRSELTFMNTFMNNFYQQNTTTILFKLLV